MTSQTEEKRFSRSQFRASWLTTSTKASDTDLEPEIQEPVGAPTPPLPPPTDFPEGGFQAWSVAAGTAAALFCTMGYLNSFGVYQTYYETHQLKDHSPSAISWIGSLQNFFVFFSSLIGGALFDRHGGPIIVVPAALAYVASIMLTSICTRYWHFILAQGVLGGASNGMVMSPALAALSQYFSRKRGAAMGLSVAGASLGAVVFPVALTKMLPTRALGFGWAVRVCGFIALALLTASCLSIRARLPPRRSDFLLPGALRRPTYALVVASTFLLFLGFFTPLYFLPSYALARGMRPDLAAYLLAILNGASFLGRVVPGVLADRVGRFNALAAAGASSGVLILCWPRCRDDASLIAFAALYGFCSGAIVSGFTVSLAFCADEPKNIGTYMGMGMAVASVAMLVGPPVNGALLARYGGFEEVAAFSGAACLVGGLVVLLAKWTSGVGLLGAL